MTTHAGVEELSAYLDGQVRGAERAGLEQHLASCPDCSATRDALQGVIRAVSTLPPVSVSPDETRVIRQAVLGRSKGHGQRMGWSFGWRVGSALAGVAAVLVGLAVFALVKVSGPRPATTAVPALSAPRQSDAKAAAPSLPDDAAVQAYARSLTGVGTFLGRPRSVTSSLPIPQAEPTACCAAALPAASPAGSANVTGHGVPAPGAQKASSPGGANFAASPPTLGSCTLAAVPSGAPVLEAQPVTYQGAPAWLIAYGTSSSGSAGTLDRVTVEVRSQSSCALLDRSTLTH